MIQTKDKKGWVYALSFLLILVIIAFSFYPARNLRLLGGGVTPYFVGIVVSILCVPYFFKSKAAIYAILYIFVVIANFFFGNKAIPTIGAALTESISILLPAATLYLIISRNEKDNIFNKLLLYSFIIIIIITTFLSYQLDNLMPGIIRAAVNYENEEELQQFYLHGLAPYSLPHALPVLIPPCLMVIKRPFKSLHRVFAIVFLLTIIFLVTLSQSFGAFLSVLFTLVISLLIKEGGLSQNIRILVFSSIIILFISTDMVQLAVVDFFKGFFESDSKMYLKLDELAAGIVMDNISEVSGNRGNLLEQTIQAIVRNPIFGVNDKSYGNHTALLDRWACYGLVGFIPLLLFIYNIIKTTLKEIPHNLQSYYIVGVLMSLVMMSTKNMMGWFQWLCMVLILPLMFIVWKSTEKTKS